MDALRRDTRSRLDHLHRIGAVVFGIGLAVFGVLGLGRDLGFFSTTGEQVMGLGTNGALSIVSLAVAAILIAAAVRGAHIASTVLVVIGAAFLLSGFVNALVLGTSLNLLAFRIPNVIFSFVAGALLLVLGAWGRFTGHLPESNPYQQQRHGHDTPDPLPSHFDDPADAVAAKELADAERAVAQHVASPETVVRVEAVHCLRREEDRVQEWRRLSGHDHR